MSCFVNLYTNGYVGNRFAFREDADRAARSSTVARAALLKVTRK